MAQFPGPLRFPHTALSQHQIHQQQQTENDKYSVKNVPVLPPQQKQDQKDSHSTVQQTMTVRLRKDQTTMMFKHKLYLWVSVAVCRLETVSDGSSPFPPEGHIMEYVGWTYTPILWRCFASQSYLFRSLNSASASSLDQLTMLESATVRCFFFVRALSSMLLRVLNSLLIKVFIV
nr:hypothetical transcript [Hymenolepis microstoma]